MKELIVSSVWTAPGTKGYVPTAGASSNLRAGPRQNLKRPIRKSTRKSLNYARPCPTTSQGQPTKTSAKRSWPSSMCSTESSAPWPTWKGSRADQKSFWAEARTASVQPKIRRPQWLLNLTADYGIMGRRYAPPLFYTFYQHTFSRYFFI